jgi:restriction endonuclease S subunit
MNPMQEQEKIALAIQVYEKRIENYQEQIESCAKRKDYQSAFIYSIMVNELKNAKLLLEQIAG